MLPWQRNSVTVSEYSVVCLAFPFIFCCSRFHHWIDSYSYMSWILVWNFLVQCPSSSSFLLLLVVTLPKDLLLMFQSLSIVVVFHDICLCMCFSWLRLYLCHIFPGTSSSRSTHISLTSVFFTIHKLLMLLHSWIWVEIHYTYM